MTSLPYIMVLYRDASSNSSGECTFAIRPLSAVSQASPSQFRFITQCIFEFSVSRESSMTEINISSSYH